MYKDSLTVVQCSVRTKDSFGVEVGLHQGSALSPFLFEIIMDWLTDINRQEDPWTMICSDHKQQMETMNIYILEKLGMKVSRNKTEYMCMNEIGNGRTVKMEGFEVAKVKEFKYLESTVQSNGK